MVDRRLVSISEATTIVGVSRRTIYNWLAAGRIESVYTAGGGVRIYADTLFRARPPRPGAVIEVLGAVVEVDGDVE